MIVMFAIIALVVMGIMAIAVDVSFAYRQRQTQQNMASNAAEAGAYQLYGFKVFGTPVGAQATADAQVLNSMKGVLSSQGITAVQLTPPYGDNACQGQAAGTPSPYPQNEVYLNAVYVNTTPTNPTSIPIVVGSGYFDPGASRREGPGTQRLHTGLLRAHTRHWAEKLLRGQQRAGRPGGERGR